MSATITIRHTRLFDGIDLRPGYWGVTIGENGRFEHITPGDAPGRPETGLQLDAAGGFLLPGLIDLHVHLSWDGGPDPAAVLTDASAEEVLLTTAANAMKYPAWGITTVRDLGSPRDAALHVERAIRRGLIAGPRIVAAGQSIIMTGGHDPFHGIMVDGPWEALKAVRRQAQAGAGVVKISATGGVYGRATGEGVQDEELRPEEIAMIVDEAHRRHLKVAAHAIGRPGIENCIDAGVDCIEHGHFIDAALALRMREKGTALVPTLHVYQCLAASPDVPAYARQKARALVAQHRQAFDLARQAGVTIGAGSDAGSPQTPHPSLLAEIRALAEAGIGPLPALTAATAGAAAVLGMPETLGVIRKGAVADCLVVAADPFADLEALSRVAVVFQEGRIVFNRLPESRFS